MFSIMEEKESVISTNNHAVENLEKSFQFSEGVAENMSHTPVKQYNRDILLQLRLHPLSLQKPETLPEIEFVKEKLNLYDITDTSGPLFKCVDPSDYSGPQKSGYHNMKNEYPFKPNYLNRLHPYCYSSQVYHGPYHNISLKYPSPYNTYCNPLKKSCAYKNFPGDECVWPKRCYASCEETWNYYPNHLPSGASKRKEYAESIPKPKKKLAIIDPCTGKDILESVAEDENKQDHADHADESSKMPENDMTEMKYSGDYLYNDVNGVLLDQVNEECENSAAFSSKAKMCHSKLKSSGGLHEGDFFAKKMSNYNDSRESYGGESLCLDDGKMEQTFHSELGTPISAMESSKTEENINELAKIVEKLHNFEMSRANKQPLKISYDRETSPLLDMYGTCHTFNKREDNAYNEKTTKQNDLTHDNLRQLQEASSLKQEQQKMAILQSFLRYKKYQLEETARNLDEKRIEIANLECTLISKAKKLLDKELMLKTQNDMLCSKAKQLAEREKNLNADKSKLSFDTCLSKNLIKETQLAEKKFSIDRSDGVWNEDLKINFNAGDCSYLSYDLNPSKAVDSISTDVETHETDTYSLNETEKYIVSEEKMHCSGDKNCDNVDKNELLSCTSVQEKDESASCGPIGYSKGRHYLPENIKYWLDERDKSSA